MSVPFLAPVHRSVEEGLIVDGLFARWPFSEGTGTSIADVGPNGIHGTAMLAGEANWVPGWRQANAFQFNQSEYISLLDDTSTFAWLQNTLLFSFTVNVKINALDDRICFCGSGRNSAEKVFSAMWENLDASRGLRAARVIANKAVQGEPVISARSDNNAIMDSNWRNLIITSDGPGNNLKFYIDNVQRPTTIIDAFTNLSVGNSQRRFYLGASNSSGAVPIDEFGGVLEDFRFYTRELNASERTRIAAGTG